tara:strand:+ start:1583 stop:1876 length:294 start_codon:yes stop_codon:yes gene_type:complete
MGVVPYHFSSGTFYPNNYTTIDIGKAMIDNDYEDFDGASSEAILLAELSFIMLDKFEKQEKLSARDFDAMWYAHVNLTMLWQAALSTKDLPQNGKLN